MKSSFPFKDNLDEMLHPDSPVNHSIFSNHTSQGLCFFVLKHAYMLLYCVQDFISKQFENKLQNLSICCPRCVSARTEVRVQVNDGRPHVRHIHPGSSTAQCKEGIRRYGSNCNNITCFLNLSTVIYNGNHTKSPIYYKLFR